MMPGIIRFDRLTRRQQPVSRRTLVLGATGLACTASMSALSVSAQEPATPVATPGETRGPVTGLLKGTARERLKGLLSLVPPEQLGGADPDAMLFSWADLQTQFLAYGNPDPLSDDTPIMPITQALYIGDPLIAYAKAPEAMESFGFSTLQVHQVLVTGAPPNQVVYYKGGMPVGDLPAIWEKAGYERKQGDAGTYWTVGEHGELDLSSPVGQMGTGMLNNVAIIDEDVLVFAPRLELIQAVQTLIGGDEDSAAERDDISELFGTMPETAVSVIGLPEAALDVSSIVPENPGAQENQGVKDLLAESDDAVGKMPVSELAFFGVTAGGDPAVVDSGTPVPETNMDGYIFVALLTSSPDNASQAKKVVDWRLANMTSATTGTAFDTLLVPDADAKEESTGPVAAMAFTSPRTLAVWYKMLMSRDLWPFVYMSGQ